MITSQLGKKFIVRKEGYTPYVYADPNGDATVGPGLFLHKGPPTRAEVERYGTRARPKISRVLYFGMLDDALISRERAIRRFVNVPINQAEFDALVSLIYNIGEGNFASSTVLRELNLGRRARAGVAFLRWVNGSNGPLPGLVIRRAQERRIFRGRARQWRTVARHKRVMV